MLLRTPDRCHSNPRRHSVNGHLEFPGLSPRILPCPPAHGRAAYVPVYLVTAGHILRHSAN